MKFNRYKTMQSVRFLIILVTISVLSLFYSNCAQNNFDVDVGSALNEEQGSNSNVVTPTPWSVSEILFIEKSSESFDLSSTLPSCKEKNGVFSVDASGKPLPSGMTLSESGILSVGSSAVGVTEGVVFACNY